jgi:hypothetical protein
MDGIRMIGQIERPKTLKLVQVHVERGPAAGVIYFRRQLVRVDDDPALSKAIKRTYTIFQRHQPNLAAIVQKIAKSFVDFQEAHVEAWRRWEVHIKSLRNSDYAAWWAQHRNSYTTAIKEFVKELVSKTPSSQAIATLHAASAILAEVIRPTLHYDKNRSIYFDDDPYGTLLPLFDAYKTIAQTIWDEAKWSKKLKEQLIPLTLAEISLQLAKGPVAAGYPAFFFRSFSISFAFTYYLSGLAKPYLEELEKNPDIARFPVRVIMRGICDHLREELPDHFEAVRKRLNEPGGLLEHDYKDDIFGLLKYMEVETHAPEYALPPKVFRKNVTPFADLMRHLSGFYTMPLTPEKVSGAAEDGDYGTALSLAVALYLQDGNVDPLIKTYDAILRGAVRSRLVEAPPTRKGVVEAQKLGVKEGIDEIVRLEKMIAPLARAIRKAHKKEVVHALKYHIPIED